jgi:hypothetical protein
VQEALTGGVWHAFRYSLRLTTPVKALIDLLWVSRHCGKPESDDLSTSTASSPDQKPKAVSVGLAAAVLDTLLCILVDSSSALRTFESVNGVHTVVKLLKRSNTLRDVR